MIDFFVSGPLVGAKVAFWCFWGLSSAEEGFVGSVGDVTLEVLEEGVAFFVAERHFVNVVEVVLITVEGDQLGRVAGRGCFILAELGVHNRTVNTVACLIAFYHLVLCDRNN